MTSSPAGPRHPAIIGYCDPLRGRPGDAISFKISSAENRAFIAKVVRIRHADPNPTGPGIKISPVETPIDGRYFGTEQAVHKGSYATAPLPNTIHGRRFFLLCNFKPTAPLPDGQCIASLHSVAGDRIAVSIAHDAIFLNYRPTGRTELSLHTDLRIKHGEWWSLGLDVDQKSNALTVELLPLLGASDKSPSRRLRFPQRLPQSRWSYLAIASADLKPQACFNGLVERPTLGLGKLPDLSETKGAFGLTANVVCRWDFSLGISTEDIFDTGPLELRGKLHNLPTRAVRGSNWTGREMCWRHAPEEYGAIHFHDDDLVDCGWSESVRLTIPPDLPSGVYGLQVDNGIGTDVIPFFVLGAIGAPRPKTAYLAPTLTYLAYANHARDNLDSAFRGRIRDWDAYPWNADEVLDFGKSTYNLHTDGSGQSLSSRRRPILTMRPSYLTFNDPKGSGLRHFPADSHLLDWLSEKEIPFDVVTDEDLDDHGLSALDGYSVLITGTHPEYYTERMLDTLAAYRGQGRHLIYLGGNGFYWRIARQRPMPHVIEIRRAETGIRTWAAEPGEYYHQLDGSYGGLWRRNGRPPQTLVGVGFAVQGKFEGSWYIRTPESHESSVSWIFDGVDDEKIGDFGLSGGGAAGFELDHASIALGTPASAVVLARSEGHNETFKGVPEDVLTHTLAIGSADGVPHADMLFDINTAGSKIFSVGSITFCGSLSHNGYSNSISTILFNVWRDFSGNRQN